MAELEVPSAASAIPPEMVEVFRQALMGQILRGRRDLGVMTQASVEALFNASVDSLVPMVQAREDFEIFGVALRAEQGKVEAAMAAPARTPELLAQPYQGRLFRIVERNDPARARGRGPVDARPAGQPFAARAELMQYAEALARQTETCERAHAETTRQLVVSRHELRRRLAQLMPAFYQLAAEMLAETDRARALSPVRARFRTQRLEAEQNQQGLESEPATAPATTTFWSTTTLRLQAVAGEGRLAALRAWIARLRSRA